MQTIRVFEAFAGYGSQAMALKRLENKYRCQCHFDFVGISEIDKYAIQAYHALHGDVRNYGDISKIDWLQVPGFDLLTYSFPCQDISAAGKQMGLREGDGTRSSLLWECRKAISAKRPKYLLMENVVALVSKKFMPEFQCWCDELVQMGYSNYWKILNAKDYGVPQSRARVFMVSILGDHKPYYFPKPFRMEKRLKDVLESNVDAKYYLSTACIDGFLRGNLKQKSKGNGFAFSIADINGVSGTLTTTMNRRTDTYIGESVMGALRGRKGESDKSEYEQRIEIRGGIANCITSVQKDNIVITKSMTDESYKETGRIAGFRETKQGNIVAYKNDGHSGTCSELVFQNPKNTAHTITTANVPKIICGHGTEYVHIRRIAGFREAKSTQSDKTEIFTEFNETNAREVLRILRQEVGEEAFDTQMGRFERFLKKEVLQQGVYETCFYQEGCGSAKSRPGTSICPKDNEGDRTEGEKMSDMRNDNWTDRYTSQGQELAQQFLREFDVCLSQLPHETSQAKECMHYLLKADGRRAWILQQALSSMEEVWQSTNKLWENSTGVRVRKLSPKECFRLMDVSDTDIEKIQSAGISRTQQYKMAGNSIVVSVLYHIFRTLFMDETADSGTQLKLF